MKETTYIANKITNDEREQIIQLETQILKLERVIISMEKTIIKKIDKRNKKINMPINPSINTKKMKKIIKTNDFQ